jgi:hypothetical protein
MRNFIRRQLQVLLICALGCVLSSAASAEGVLNFDKEFGTVSGWKVGFSVDRRGCLAAARFDGDTTFWVGYTGTSNDIFVAFTNPGWKSIESEGGYQIVLRTRTRTWNGKFYGFERKNEKGIYRSNLKDDFVQDLAASREMRVFVDGKLFFSSSLTGLRDALKEVISCQTKFVEAASGAESGGGPGENGQSSGTGFFVTSQGHVLTNNHVIEGCTSINVLQAGSSDVRASVIARDKTNDLAILKTGLEPSAVPFLRPDIKVGENVSVYGFPLPDKLSTSGNFTAGSITAASGLSDDSRMFQMSAPVQPGNSGGPVIDKSGNVVGVVVSKLNALRVAADTNDIPQNVNFAIKAAIAVNFLASKGISNAGRQRTSTLAPENIAELAKLFTVQITCR